jgi:hypothetical protein
VSGGQHTSTGFPRLRCAAPCQLSEPVDKNSLWDGLNIQKRQLCVNEIIAEDFGFVLGLFSGDSGDFREEEGDRRMLAAGATTGICGGGNNVAAVKILAKPPSKPFWHAHTDFISRKFYSIFNSLFLLVNQKS